MADDATPPATPQDKSAQVDYFGFGGIDRFVLPDGVSWVDIKTMNEGERRRYQNKTTRDMRVGQDGDAKFSLSPGEDRLQLLSIALADWNLMSNGTAVIFNRGNLEKFLDKADPSIIDLIDNEVRQRNSWLTSEQTVEQMEKEIDRLEERIAAARADEEGKE